MVMILSTLNTFGTVANSCASQGQPTMDMEMTGSESQFLFRMGRSKKFSTISTADSTHVFVAHLRAKGNDQFCILEKLLMGLTMLKVMADAHLLSFSDYRSGCLGSVNYCQVGCGYWDDFRNPGPVLRDVQPQPLRQGETIDGIQHPSSDVCSQPKCKGASIRLLTTAGYWQNNA